ncbi:MAG: cobalamin-dependent protein, partial [Candidatus Omnitrophota bacterium]|nr:cobalamin-dependent protein [Candidatus Omnitrophota bacterium]
QINSLFDLLRTTPLNDDERRLSLLIFSQAYDFDQRGLSQSQIIEELNKFRVSLPKVVELLSYINEQASPEWRQDFVYIYNLTDMAPYLPINLSLDETYPDKEKFGKTLFSIVNPEPGSYPYNFNIFVNILHETRVVFEWYRGHIGELDRNAMWVVFEINLDKVRINTLFDVSVEHNDSEKRLARLIPSQAFDFDKDKLNDEEIKRRLNIFVHSITNMVLFHEDREARRSLATYYGHADDWESWAVFTNDEYRLVLALAEQMTDIPGVRTTKDVKLRFYDSYSNSWTEINPSFLFSNIEATKQDWKNKALIINEAGSAIAYFISVGDKSDLKLTLELETLPDGSKRIKDNKDRAAIDSENSAIRFDRRQTGTMYWIDVDTQVRYTIYDSALIFSVEDIIHENLDRRTVMEKAGSKIRDLYGYDLSLSNDNDRKLYQTTVAYFVSQIKRTERTKGLAINIDLGNEYKVRLIINNADEVVDFVNRLFDIVSDQEVLDILRFTTKLQGVTYRNLNLENTNVKPNGILRQICEDLAWQPAFGLRESLGQDRKLHFVPTLGSTSAVKEEIREIGRMQRLVNHDTVLEGILNNYFKLNTRDGLISQKLVTWFNLASLVGVGKDAIFRQPERLVEYLKHAPVVMEQAPAILGRQLVPTQDDGRDLRLLMLNIGGLIYGPEIGNEKTVYIYDDKFDADIKFLENTILPSSGYVVIKNTNPAIVLSRFEVYKVENGKIYLTLEHLVNGHLENYKPVGDVLLTEERLIDLASGRVEKSTLIVDGRYYWLTEFDYKDSSLDLVRTEARDFGITYQYHHTPSASRMYWLDSKTGQKYPFVFANTTGVNKDAKELTQIATYFVGSLDKKLKTVTQTVDLLTTTGRVKRGEIVYEDFGFGQFKAKFKNETFLGILAIEGTYQDESGYEFTITLDTIPNQGIRMPVTVTRDNHILLKGVLKDKSGEYEVELDPRYLSEIVTRIDNHRIDGKTEEINNSDFFGNIARHFERTQYTGAYVQGQDYKEEGNLRVDATGERPIFNQGLFEIDTEDNLGLRFYRKLDSAHLNATVFKQNKTTNAQTTGERNKDNFDGPVVLNSRYQEFFADGRPAYYQDFNFGQKADYDEAGRITDVAISDILGNRYTATFYRDLAILLVDDEDQATTTVLDSYGPLTKSRYFEPQTGYFKEIDPGETPTVISDGVVEATVSDYFVSGLKAQLNLNHLGGIQRLLDVARGMEITVDPAEFYGPKALRTVKTIGNKVETTIASFVSETIQVNGKNKDVFHETLIVDFGDAKGVITQGVYRDRKGRPWTGIDGDGTHFAYSRHFGPYPTITDFVNGGLSAHEEMEWLEGQLPTKETINPLNRGELSATKNFYTDNRGIKLTIYRDVKTADAIRIEGDLRITESEFDYNNLTVYSEIKDLFTGELIVRANSILSAHINRQDTIWYDSRAGRDLILRQPNVVLNAYGRELATIIEDEISVPVYDGGLEIGRETYRAGKLGLEANSVRVEGGSLIRRYVDYKYSNTGLRRTVIDIERGIVYSEVLDRAGRKIATYRDIAGVIILSTDINYQSATERVSSATEFKNGILKRSLTYGEVDLETGVLPIRVTPSFGLPYTERRIFNDYTQRWLEKEYDDGWMVLPDSWLGRTDIELESHLQDAQGRIREVYRTENNIGEEENVPLSLTEIFKVSLFDEEATTGVKAYIRGTDILYYSQFEEEKSYFDITTPYPAATYATDLTGAGRVVSIDGHLKDNVTKIRSTEPGIWAKIAKADGQMEYGFVPQELIDSFIEEGRITEEDSELALAVREAQLLTSKVRIVTYDIFGNPLLIKEGIIELPVGQELNRSELVELLNEPKSESLYVIRDELLYEATTWQAKGEGDKKFYEQISETPEDLLDNPDFNQSGQRRDLETGRNTFKKNWINNEWYLSEESRLFRVLKTIPVFLDLPQGKHSFYASRVIHYGILGKQGGQQFSSDIYYDEMGRRLADIEYRQNRKTRKQGTAQKVVFYLTKNLPTDLEYSPLKDGQETVFNLTGNLTGYDFIAFYTKAEGPIDVKTTVTTADGRSLVLPNDISYWNPVSINQMWFPNTTMPVRNSAVVSNDTPIRNRNLWVISLPVLRSAGINIADIKEIKVRADKPFEISGMLRLGDGSLKIDSVASPTECWSERGSRSQRKDFINFENNISCQIGFIIDDNFVPWAVTNKHRYADVWGRGEIEPLLFTLDNPWYPRLGFNFWREQGYRSSSVSVLWPTQKGTLSIKLGTRNAFAAPEFKFYPQANLEDFAIFAAYGSAASTIFVTRSNSLVDRFLVRANAGHAADLLIKVFKEAPYLKDDLPGIIKQLEKYLDAQRVNDSFIKDFPLVPSALLLREPDDSNDSLTASWIKEMDIGKFKQYLTPSKTTGLISIYPQSKEADYVSTEQEAELILFLIENNFINEARGIIDFYIRISQNGMKPIASSYNRKIGIAEYLENNDIPHGADLTFSSQIAVSQAALIFYDKTKEIKYRDFAYNLALRALEFRDGRGCFSHLQPWLPEKQPAKFLPISPNYFSIKDASKAYLALRALQITLESDTSKSAAELKPKIDSAIVDLERFLDYVWQHMQKKTVSALFNDLFDQQSSDVAMKKDRIEYVIAKENWSSPETSLYFIIAMHYAGKSNEELAPLLNAVLSLYKVKVDKAEGIDPSLPLFERPEAIDPAITALFKRAANLLEQPTLISWSDVALATIYAAKDSLPSRLIMHPADPALREFKALPTGQTNSESWIHLDQNNSMPLSLYGLAQLYYAQTGKLPYEYGSITAKENYKDYNDFKEKLQQTLNNDRKKNKNNAASLKKIKNTLHKLLSLRSNINSEMHYAGMLGIGAINLDLASLTRNFELKHWFWVATVLFLSGLLVYNLCWWALRLKWEKRRKDPAKASMRRHFEPNSPIDQILLEAGRQWADKILLRKAYSENVIFVNGPVEVDFLFSLRTILNTVVKWNQQHNGEKEKWLLDLWKFIIMVGFFMGKTMKDGKKDSKYGIEDCNHIWHRLEILFYNYQGLLTDALVHNDDTTFENLLKEMGVEGLNSSIDISQLDLSVMNKDKGNVLISNNNVIDTQWNELVKELTKLGISRKQFIDFVKLFSDFVKQEHLHPVPAFVTDWASFMPKLLFALLGMFIYAGIKFNINIIQGFQGAMNSIPALVWLVTSLIIVAIIALKVSQIIMDLKSGSLVNALRQSVRYLQAGLALVLALGAMYFLAVNRFNMFIAGGVVIVIGLLLAEALCLIRDKYSFLWQSIWYFLRPPFHPGSVLSIITYRFMHLIFLGFSIFMGWHIVNWFVNFYMSGEPINYLRCLVGLGVLVYTLYNTHNAIWVLLTGLASATRRFTWQSAAVTCSLLGYYLGLPADIHLFWVLVGLAYVLGRFVLRRGKSAEDIAKTKPEDKEKSKTVILYIGGETLGIRGAYSNPNNATEDLIDAWKWLRANNGRGLSMRLKEWGLDGLNEAEIEERLKGYFNKLHEYELIKNGVSLFDPLQFDIPGRRFSFDVNPDDRDKVIKAWSIRNDLWSMIPERGDSPKGRRTGAPLGLNAGINFVAKAKEFAKRGMGNKVCFLLMSNKYNGGPKPEDLFKNPSREILDRQALAELLEYILNDGRPVIGRSVGPNGKVEFDAGQLRKYGTAYVIHCWTVFSSKAAAMAAMDGLPEEALNFGSFNVLDRMAVCNDVASYVSDIIWVRNNKNFTVCIHSRTTTNTLMPIGKGSEMIESGHRSYITGVYSLLGGKSGESICTGWGSISACLYGEVMRVMLEYPNYPMVPLTSALRCLHLKRYGLFDLIMSSLFGLIGFILHAVGISEDMWASKQASFMQMGLGRRPYYDRSKSIGTKLREAFSHSCWAPSAFQRWSAGGVQDSDDYLQQKIHDYGPASVEDKEIRRNGLRFFLSVRMSKPLLVFLPIALVFDLTPFKGILLIFYLSGFLANQILKIHGLIVYLEGSGFYWFSAILAGVLGYNYTGNLHLAVLALIGGGFIIGLGRWLAGIGRDFFVFSLQPTVHYFAQSSRRWPYVVTMTAVTFIFCVNAKALLLFIPIVLIYSMFLFSTRPTLEFKRSGGAEDAYFGKDNDGNRMVNIFDRLFPKKQGRRCVLPLKIKEVDSTDTCLTLRFIILFGVVLVLLQFVTLTKLDTLNIIMFYANILYGVCLVIGPFVINFKPGRLVWGGFGDLLSEIFGWGLGALTLLGITAVLMVSTDELSIGLTKALGLLALPLGIIAVVSIILKHITKQWSVASLPRLLSGLIRGYFTSFALLIWFAFIPRTSLIYGTFGVNQLAVDYDYALHLLFTIIKIIGVLILIYRVGGFILFKVCTFHYNRMIEKYKALGQINSQIEGLLEQATTFMHQENYAYVLKIIKQINGILSILRNLPPRIGNVSSSPIQPRAPNGGMTILPLILLSISTLLLLFASPALAQTGAETQGLSQLTHLIQFISSQLIPAEIIILGLGVGLFFAVWRVFFPANWFLWRLRKTNYASTRTEETRAQKILLIQPRIPGLVLPPTRFPLAIMLLASAIRDRGFLKEFFARKYGQEVQAFTYPAHEVKLLDLQAERADFDLKGFVGQFKPDVVGISFITSNYGEAQRMASLIKEISPESKIIFGGIHASALPEKTLSESDADIIVYAEGIETFCELVTELARQDPNLSSINGIYYKNGQGGISQNPPNKRLMTLDEYPFAFYSRDLLNLEGYADFIDHKDRSNKGKPATLWTSQGCTGNCNFCAMHKIFPYVIEHRSAENVFQEIKLWYEQGHYGFFVADDVFTADTERLNRLAGEIKKERMGVFLIVLSRADCIDQQRLSALKKMNVGTISVALETGSQRLLNMIGKGLKVEDVARAISLSKQNGFETRLFLMVGFPTETIEDVLMTADFLVTHNTEIDEVNVSITMPYPGTRLYDDSRISVLPEFVDRPECWQHQPEMGHKDQVMPARTKTDTMTPNEITAARMFLLAIFANRNNPETVDNLKEAFRSLTSHNATSLITEFKKKLEEGKLREKSEPSLPTPAASAQAKIEGLRVQQ